MVIKNIMGKISPKVLFFMTGGTVVFDFDDVRKVNFFGSWAFGCGFVSDGVLRADPSGWKSLFPGQRLLPAC